MTRKRIPLHVDVAADTQAAALSAATA